MNFNQVYNARGQKDDKGYNIKTDMFGVLTMVGGFESMGSSGAMKSKCKVKDDAGYERTVTFMGKDLPQPNMLNHRVLLSCWAEEWYSQKLSKNMVSFSAWLKNANVSQTTPQNPSQQAPQPQQAKNAPKAVQTDDRNYSFALSYAKDMVCANSLKWIDFWPTVEAFQRYLETGKTPMVKDDEQSSEEDLPANFGEESKQEGDEIPF